MVGWIVRALLFLAGMITGLFVARDENNFEVVQMMVAIGLFTLAAAIFAFAPLMKRLWKKKREKDNSAADED